MRRRVQSISILRATEVPRMPTHAAWKCSLSYLAQELSEKKFSLNEVPNANLSNDEKACFESLEAALKVCKTMCDDFASKISKMTSHSQAKWWDRARLHFYEKDLTLLKSNLETHKQTVTVVIGIATLKTVSKNREALQNLEIEIAFSVNHFAGQIMELKTALHLAIKQEDVENTVRVLKEHGRVLKLCLESCTSGLKETTARAGTQVKYAKSFNDARQAIGTMGNVTGGESSINVEYAEAHDKSMQFVGSMDGESAKVFWTAK